MKRARARKLNRKYTCLIRKFIVVYDAGIKDISRIYAVAHRSRTQ